MLIPAVDSFAAAFAALVISLHAPSSCQPPVIEFDSYKIRTSCQMEAQPGMAAMSCYDPAKKVIYLDDFWDADSHSDQKLLYHEMDRHIEQACLGHAFTEAEPVSVLAAEQLAP